MKILLIDDSLLMVQIITKALKDLGYSDVVSFHNPLEALAYVSKAQNLGLILCDWNMPGMTGMEILKEVRGSSNTAKTPFFMVTSRGTQGDLMEALKAGVTNYLVKPIQIIELKEKLNSIDKSS